MRVQSPLIYMARLCKARANKGGDDNYHIFLNSVEGITRIIRLAGLRPDECRIVCSQSGDSKDNNQKKLGEFMIQTTTDPVKTFNFYTSTCFEGQDIYDESGRIFIVSEAFKDHTKMDVMTTLLQICGRIRDSRYNNEINQFYAQSEYKDVSLEEYKKSIEKDMEEAEKFAEILDQAPAGNRRERIIRDFVNKDPCIAVIDDKIVVDRNIANLKIVNYGIINGQYATQCNMNASLEKAGFQVTNDAGAYDSDEELESLLSIERTPFKEIFEEYAEIRESKGYNLDCFRRSRIEVEKPLVKKAYDVLGPSKVREMNYHQANIKRELTKRMHENLDSKIFLMIDDKLDKQIAIPKSEIKQLLNDIYKELGINKKAKATDLNQ